MLFALVPLFAAGVAQAGPVQTSPKLSKELVINSYQLYPENIDYDTRTRLAYIRYMPLLKFPKPEKNAKSR